MDATRRTSEAAFVELAKRFGSARIAVVGDLILDVYVWVDASRISQEAPVPVLRVNKTTRTLGGAANVARNLASLGAKSAVFGVAGDDSNADEMERLLSEDGISSEGIGRVSGRPTTEKQRVVASSQQLVRIDYEDVSPVPAEVVGAMVAKLKESLARGDFDAVVLEDYAKGLLDAGTAAEIAEAAGAAGIPLALDPHPGHPLDFQGVDIMTPNHKEAFGLAGIYHGDADGRGLDRLDEVAEKIRERWNPKHLLITLGPEGVALFERDGGKTIIPTRAREVFDVSGAGDTFIATFTLAIVSGATAVEAAEIANHASGVVVGKVGTSPATLEELLESFKRV